MARGYGKPETKPTKFPSEIDIAWAAGVYEGEGNVARTNEYACSRIMVSQKDPEILYRLRDWFGGSVNRNSGRKKCPEETIHKWIACGDHGRVFAALIYKYLSSRRRTQIDATRILDFLEGVDPASLSMEQLRVVAFDFTEKRFKKSPRAVQSRKRGWAKNRGKVLNPTSYAPQERVM